MNILIAGATGNTGQRLVKELISRNHTPIALVRESSYTSKLPEGVTLRQGDLTDLQEGVCDGCEAVVFAAGFGGNTGPEMTDKVDRDGAKRLIDLAAKAGVGRFVMLSSVGTEDPEHELGHYLQAKHEADEHLKASGLTYAIVRPVQLTDEDGDRSIALGNNVDPMGKAARGDVAASLADGVESSDWVGQVRLMQSV